MNLNNNCFSFLSNYIAKEPIRLPVIVFIHGESYEWNAGSSYDGSVLASYGNVVVVTINYRLGVLGLFHRAIMQSGSVLSPWAMATDAVGYSRRLARKLGCPDDYGKNSVIVDCLRQKSARELVTVNFKVANHLTSLGPTVDGIVIPNDPSTLMAEYNSFYGNYELLFGVTKVEFYQFTRDDERNGIDSQRRDKILRTLVRNLFSFHLQEIYLTVANEYTDWTQSTIDSSSIFQMIIDLLSDSTVVAPSVKAGQMHSRLQRNTYFYTFLYASEHGNYPANIGCVEGEDLPYLFGAPLVPGMQLGFFVSSYNKAEVALSETVMNLWANFARYGNPTPNVNSGENNNGNNNKHAKSSPLLIKALSNIAEKLAWPQYDEKEQRYLSISKCLNKNAEREKLIDDRVFVRLSGTNHASITVLKPKVRDHYQAHRLSYWLNLIPKLHVPGPTSSSQEHHLLQDFDDIHSYEGIVREVSVSSSSSSPSSDSNTNRIQQQKAITIQSYNEVQIDLPTKNHSHPTAASSNKDLPRQVTISTLQSSTSSPSQSTVAENDRTKNRPKEDAFESSVKNENKNNINASVSMLMQQGSYSTALSVTIAIGCSLLILNILIFAGIVYQRDRLRNAADASDKNCK
ncbi:neuroligin-4: X-linked-like protein, partial [Dinothrombium tinctorium]